MSEPREQMIECSVCGWRHTVPCGRDDCPHDLATVYAAIARELDNAVANGCMEQLAKMSAEDIAYDLAQHSASCERIAISILTSGVKAWLRPQDGKDRNNPEAIRERCRRAADRFIALAADARVDAVVSADLLLEAASLLKGYNQSLLLHLPHAAATARIAALEAENQRLKCRDAERQVDDYRSGYSAGWSDGKNGTPMRDRVCAALFFGQRVSAAPENDQAPCPVCDNEERGQGGYLQCECPAPLSSTAGGQ